VAIDPRFVNVDEVDLAKNKSLKEARESEIPSLNIGEPKAEFAHEVAQENSRILGSGGLSREGDKDQIHPWTVALAFLTNPAAGASLSSGAKSTRISTFFPFCIHRSCKKGDKCLVCSSSGYSTAVDKHHREGGNCVKQPALVMIVPAVMTPLPSVPTVSPRPVTAVSSFPPLLVSLSLLFSPLSVLAVVLATYPAYQGTADCP